MVFGSDEVIETEDEPPEYFTGPGITQVLSMEESDVVLASEKVIAYEKQLLLLAKTKIDERCLVKGCPELVEISTKYVASALYIIWVSLTSVIIKYCIHTVIFCLCYFCPSGLANSMVFPHLEITKTTLCFKKDN